MDKERAEIRMSPLEELIGESELRFTFSRSGGPGGQNVNKVNTRVTLWFDLESCPVLTPEQKIRIRDRLASRISKAGELRVVSSKARTQAANREAAIARLRELLRSALSEAQERVPTRLPRQAREKRLTEKHRRGTTKQRRGQVREEE